MPSPSLFLIRYLLRYLRFSRRYWMLSLCRLAEESSNFWKNFSLFVFTDKQYNVFGPIIRRDKSNTTIRNVGNYLPEYNNVIIAENLNQYVS